MGMSASQARLLSITSRLSDTEYKGQKIANDKIRLGNDSEQIYANYLEALEGKKFQINVWDDSQGKQVQKDLTLALLSSNGYRVTTRDGVVATAPAENARPASYFASGTTENEEATTVNEADESDTSAEETSTATPRSIMQARRNFGSIVSSEAAETTSASSIDRSTNTTSTVLAEETSGTSNRLNASTNFVFDSTALEDIGSATSSTITNSSSSTPTRAPEVEDTETLRPYTEGEELYVRLQEDPSYLTNALEAGYLILQTEDENDDGNSQWVNISVSATDDISQVTDNSDVAIAEAQYSADMAKLNTKEERLDMELTRINTEHNALQTEYDSVKQVIQRNQERTFKLFS